MWRDVEESNLRPPDSYSGVLSTELTSQRKIHVHGRTRGGRDMESDAPRQCGWRGRIRTDGLLVNSQAHYHFATRQKMWRHVRESNPRLLARQASTLAAELTWHKRVGWGSRIRTSIFAFKARCPAVRRSPKQRWWTVEESNLHLSA